jgi:hypothetical protein
VGRYVRVQLLSTGALSLAEVQVFNGNYVEPHRYPIDVRDPDATTGPGGVTVPGTDGWFESLMYNPNTGLNEWGRVRGNLL